MSELEQLEKAFLERQMAVDEMPFPTKDQCREEAKAWAALQEYRRSHDLCPIVGCRSTVDDCEKWTTDEDHIQYFPFPLQGELGRCKALARRVNRLTDENAALRAEATALVGRMHTLEREVERAQGTGAGDSNRQIPDEYFGEGEE